MTRIFRAFLWLRWRVFVNSLERTSARDTLERFSLATEKLGPLIALTLLIPSSLGLAAIGLVAGYGTATGSWLIPMEVVRYFLLASTGTASVLWFVLLTGVIISFYGGGFSTVPAYLKDLFASKRAHPGDAICTRFSG